MYIYVFSVIMFLINILKFMNSWMNSLLNIFLIFYMKILFIELIILKHFLYYYLLLKIRDIFIVYN